MKNIIAFRNGFINVPDLKLNYTAEAMTVAAELMQFGYLLDTSAILALSKTSIVNIFDFHKEVISYVKKLTGSERTYKPFWPGFPEQVMEQTEFELWFYQIIHYMSNGTYMPNDWTKARSTAFEQPNYSIISGGNDMMMNDVFAKLVSVNNSLTPEDSSFVEWFIENNYKLPVNTKVPFKETSCMLMAKGVLMPSTVTDVLRVAVYMSGGDVSLPAVPDAQIKMNAWSSKKTNNPARELFKFKKFTRAERRLLLSMLEMTNCDVREMKLKAHRWIRLAEIIHPGEYKNQFPIAYEAFNQLRNEKIVSWYGEINKAFDKSYEKGILKIAERPGEFLRRLDYLVRTAKDNQLLILFNVLSKVISKSSNKVLFEVYNHFLKRDVVKTGRKVLIKGKRKATLLPDLPALDINIINQINELIFNTLQQKFAALDKLGNVYIDKELKKIPVPTNMRSMNLSLKPAVRGTRIPIGNQNAKVIRAFVHWFDENGREDIDLTATFIGSNITRIGWNGSKNSSIGCYSGDVRHRQGACAEYIDIDIQNALNAGYDYAILDARNYTGKGLNTVKECVFGYMEREFPKENEIFVPATLANTVLLQSTSANTVVAAIDLRTQEYIFLDIDQEGLPVASANVVDIIDALNTYMEAPKFSIYDLILLHFDRFTSIVDNKEDADKTFMFDDFVNSYVDTLTYMGV